jgi:hypothetical protein
MQSLEHIEMSVVTNEQGILTSFPPLKKVDQATSKNIKEAVFRSMNFTSKFANMCEISKELSQDVYLHTIKGAQNIRNHHCAGEILYNKDYEYLLADINIYFEIQEKYFQNHSFDNMKLMFERSNGDIIEGTVLEDSGILYIPSRDELALYITFTINDEKLFKWIPLNDTFSKSLNKKTTGLLSLNKELNNKELIIYVNKTPEWLKTERDTFLEMMENKLKKTKLQYSFRPL